MKNISVSLISNTVEKEPRLLLSRFMLFTQLIRLIINLTGILFIYFFE